MLTRLYNLSLEARSGLIPKPKSLKDVHTQIFQARSSSNHKRSSLALRPPKYLLPSTCKHRLEICASRIYVVDTFTMIKVFMHRSYQAQVLSNFIHKPLLLFAISSCVILLHPQLQTKSFSEASIRSSHLWNFKLESCTTSPLQTPQRIATQRWQSVLVIHSYFLSSLQHPFLSTYTLLRISNQRKIGQHRQN